MKLQDQELLEPENPPNPAGFIDSAPGHVFNKWRVIPYAVLKATYDDNIFISSQSPSPDVYFTFAPGIAVGWGAVRRDLGQVDDYFRHVDTPKVETSPQEEGNYVFANYSLSQTLFVDHPAENALNHDASIAGEWRFEKILFAARARYQTLSGLDIDVGGRTNRDLFTAQISSKYSLSDKTAFEVNISNTNSNYQSALSSNETIDENWVDYQITPKITAGLGVTVGLLGVQNSPSQTYEQILLRGIYAGSGKLFFSINGGIEARQLDAGERYNPVFTVGATYNATDQTTLSFDGFRRTFSSLSTGGQDAITTGLDLRVKQRCFEKIYLTLALGYQRSEYVGTIPTTIANRTDNGYFVQAGLSFDVTKWISFEVAYEFRKNQSTEADKAFQENLLTLQMSVFF